MIKALAESARLSNLPTVWTNVLVGTAAVGWAEGAQVRVPSAMLWAMLVTTLLYAGGMFLNDAIDADWDRAHGKNRPIAAGRLTRPATYAWSIASLILGVAIAGAATGGNTAVAQIGVGLVVCIILYDTLHKRSAWCVLLMGACRAMVYPLAAAIVLADHGGTLRSAFVAVYPASLAILAYTALLTLAARREDIAGARVGGLWAWIVPVPHLSAAVLYRPERTAGVLICTLLAAAVFAAWSIRSVRLARAGNIPGAVSGWLAGICLADALLLVLMNRIELAGFAIAGWLLTVVLQRKISGT